jgi:hypothetical protein
MLPQQSRFARKGWRHQAQAYAALGVAVVFCGAPALAASSAPVDSPMPGSVGPPPDLRRLTRTEYANSVRDLFGIDFPFFDDLAADGQALGFDNIGAALSLSPELLDGYLKVSRKVSELILGTGTVSVVSEVFPAIDSQSEWQEGMPIGTRGGILANYYFPRRGEYELGAFLANNDLLTGTAYPLTPTEGQRVFHVRIKVSAGPHTFAATFPDHYAEREGPVPNLDGHGGPRLGGPLDIRASAIHPTIQFWLDGKLVRTLLIQGPPAGEPVASSAEPGPPTLAKAEITGPFNPSPVVDTEARRKLLACTPQRIGSESPCAARILAQVARRAYRRDVTSIDMAPILAAFARKRQSGTFVESIGMGLRTILMSPDFLFRIEHDPPGARPGEAYRISDYELATRLSYFVWSSIPDEELLREAHLEHLGNHVTLERELRRMLSDSRADALIDNFGLEWLGVRDLSSVRPALWRYRQFDLGLAHDFGQETRLFLLSLLRDNRSVLNVISSDYTFLNQRLAELYGISGVYGPSFRRVTLTESEHRGGVLTQGSILMSTSHAETTSPVLRGRWVLANLLDRPPPTPPPGVPPLNTKPDADGRKLTNREQLERHRSSPVCAACHTKMDPYGMALENYDVLGRWRTEDNGSPIDASATLPHGLTFTGPEGLKKALLSRPDEFARATISRLMTYALGRELDKNDASAIQQIMEETRARGYRFADLVIAVATSAPFQMRQAQENALEAATGMVQGRSP